MVGEGQTNLRDAIAIAKDIKCKLQERKIDVLMIQSMLEDVVLFRSLKLSFFSTGIVILLGFETLGIVFQKMHILP